MAEMVHVLKDRAHVRATTSGRRGSAPAPKYSVVFVLVDDVGVEYLDYHGLGEQHAAGTLLPFSTTPWSYFSTPRLTSIANRGVFFQNFFTTPLCATSRARAHSGKRLDQLGLGRNIRGPGTSTNPANWPSCGIALDSSGITMLAKSLRNSDPAIETAHFGKWHMSDVWGTVGTGLPPHAPTVNLTDPALFGFQTSTWGPLPNGGGYSWWKVVNGVASYIDGIGTATFNETTHAASVMSNVARTWIAGRTGQFFCSVSLEFTHMPLDIPPYSLLSGATQAALTSLGLPAGHRLTGALDQESPRIDTGFWPALYANAEAMDTVIGRIEDAIPAALKPTTFIVVVSDNGGNAAVIPNGFPQNIDSAKGSLSRGGTNTTCVVYGPRVARPGRSMKQICDIGDLYRTFTTLMGHPAGDGVSMVPAILDEVNRDDVRALKPYSIEQAFFPIGVTDTTQFLQWGRAIVDGEFRYIDNVGVESFFDLRTDPLETVNLIAGALQSDQGDRLALLKAELNAVLPPN